MTRLPGFLNEEQDIRHWATHYRPLQEQASDPPTAAEEVPAPPAPRVRRIRSSARRRPLDRSKLPHYLRGNARFRP